MEKTSPMHLLPVASVGRKARGFTLIELLVVISIVALIVSILLPSLAAARGVARMATCQSAIRQINISLHAYLADHRDFLPRQEWQATYTWYPAFEQTWFGAVAPYLGIHYDYNQPVYWTAEEAGRIARCPTHRLAGGPAGSDVAYFSYRANGYLVLDQGETAAIDPQASYPRPVHADDVQQPSNKVSFLEVHVNDPWPGRGDERYVGADPYDRFSALNLNVHNGNANSYGFMDGHVASWNDDRAYTMADLDELRRSHFEP